MQPLKTPKMFVRANKMVVRTNTYCLEKHKKSFFLETFCLVFPKGEQRPSKGADLRVTLVCHFLTPTLSFLPQFFVANYPKSSIFPPLG